MRNVVFFSGLPESGQQVLFENLKSRFDVQMASQSLDRPVLDFARWLVSGRRVRELLGHAAPSAVGEVVWQLYVSVYGRTKSDTVVIDDSPEWIRNLEIMRVFTPALKMVVFARDLATLYPVVESKLLETHDAFSFPEMAYDRAMFVLGQGHELGRALAGMRNMVDVGTPQNLYLAKYEAIIADPVAVATDVARFLELAPASLAGAPLPHIQPSPVPPIPPRIAAYIAGEFAWYFRDLGYGQVGQALRASSPTVAPSVGPISPAEDKMIADLERAIKEETALPGDAAR